MKDFTGKIAVVTGGGTGMGRELVRQLAAEGCNVAMCDVTEATMAETQRLVAADKPPQGTKVTAHKADVSIEAHLLRFRDEIAKQMDTDKIHLLFNNAGVGGGGSVIVDKRDSWERTFNICWGGVYLGVRTFLPMLMKASEGHIINTSSVNGFYASIGQNTPHTAYSAAKFAVKGFTEALMTDLRVNAPHIKCSVVMPGHIGTEIIANSRKIVSGNEELTADDFAFFRARAKAQGIDESQLTDAMIAGMAQMMAAGFRDNAPMTAAAAAKVILDGVKADKWRILVGEDAHRLDEFVRKDPEHAYDVDFFTLFPSAQGSTR